MDNLNENANVGERHDANNIVQQALFIISCTKWTGGNLSSILAC